MTTTPLRTRLDDKEMAALKVLAKKQDRSVCALVRVAVREYITNNISATPNNTNN